MKILDSLVDSCAQIFSKNGRFSTAIPGFIAREPQSELAQVIAQTILDKTILVAEAGTGTGKTFAYLVPALLSKKKTLISTATKTLQDQLFQKDLPLLIKALGLSVRIQNLKGRANYICHYRVGLHSEESQFQKEECAHEIHHIKSKLSQMQTGERSELVEIAEDSPVWHYATSTADNCLGQECPNLEDCFLVKARKRAMDADVVVINHHLFFADSRLKQAGFGELLPQFEAVIFDEAHQLAEIATHFNGQHLGTRQFCELVDDMLLEWPSLDLINQPLKALRHKITLLMDELLLLLSLKEERVGWESLTTNPLFNRIWQEWLALKNELLQCFNEDNTRENPALLRCKERLLELESILLSFNQDAVVNILWVERFKHTVIFHATPCDISDYFIKLLKHDCAYIFTSATLTMASSFEYFCKPLGLENVGRLLLPSPFNFEEQALLYLPRGLPDPKDPLYNELLLERMLPLIEACGGRCFFLFTSHKALKQVAQMLPNKLKYPLLIQGDEAKPILLARFRQLGNAVLLGTATFWEGVDVKGEALSCVIIDKIPFASPVDPIISGRISYLKQRGLSGFDEISLPNAVIALKQGVGRLIRDVHDKGVLVIADPRLTSRDYGRHILASLPKITKTRDEHKVLQFIKELALDHEIISD